MYILGHKHNIEDFLEHPKFTLIDGDSKTLPKVEQNIGNRLSLIIINPINYEKF